MRNQTMEILVRDIWFKAKLMLQSDVESEDQIDTRPAVDSMLV